MSTNALHRNVTNAPHFNRLVPESEATQINLGKGDTYFSVEMIAMWIMKYKSQADLIAKQLLANDLQTTLYNVHSFLFNGFQYKADGKKQYIKALSYAWLNRYSGMDCKSFTTVGGQILATLGIKFYIRKIKQKDFAPNHFSHVYLIVPKNQKTGSLTDGYYTIDGTLRSMKEPEFIDKEDKYMDGFEHYGLAGTQQLNGVKLSDIKNINLSNVFNQISCIGGTAFDKDKVKQVIETITAYFFDIIDRYNQAIANKDWNQVHKIYIEYWAKREALIHTYSIKYSSKDWNKCSDDNFIYVMNFLNDKIWKILGLAFEKHILEYFNIGNEIGQYTFTQPANMPDTFDGVYMWGTAIPNPYTSSVHGYRSITPKKDEILAFQITPALASAMNSNANSFNTSSLINDLQTISEVIFSVVGSNSGTGNGSNSNNNNGQIIDYNDPKIKPKKAGFGLIAGTIIVVAGIAVATTKMKDNPKETKKTNKDE